jgi:arsenite methyltransferase
MPSPGLTGAPDPIAAAKLADAAATFAHADYLTATFDLAASGMAELYDAVVVPQWSKPFASLLLSQALVLPRPPGAQVLDVACGTGFPTLELARHFGKDTDIAGIDLWEAAIERARAKAADEWLRHVTFITGDITRAPLPEDHFDLLTCNLGYTSFADRSRALSMMSRLTRPGGWVLLTTPLQTAFHEFLDLFHAVLTDLQLSTCVDALVALVKGRPTIATTRAALERAGLVVEREVTDRFTMRFLDARDFFTSPAIALGFLIGWRAIVPDLALRRLVFNEIERRMAARVAAEGELTFSVPTLCLRARRIVR